MKWIFKFAFALGIAILFVTNCTSFFEEEEIPKKTNWSGTGGGSAGSVGTSFQPSSGTSYQPYGGTGGGGSSGGSASLKFYFDDGKGSLILVEVGAAKSQGDASWLEIKNALKTKGLDAENFTLPPNIKDAFTFTGWKTNGSPVYNDADRFAGGTVFVLNLTANSGFNTYEILYGASGASATTHVSFPSSEGSKKLSEILAKAGFAGEPKKEGLDFFAWDVTVSVTTTTVSKADVSTDGTTFSGGAAIKPVFGVTYSVDLNGSGIFQNVQVRVNDGDEKQKTLKEIFAAAGIAGGIPAAPAPVKPDTVFEGWTMTAPDGTENNIFQADLAADAESSKQKFAAGTKIKPCWQAVAHVHVYSPDWSSDGSDHWHEAVCHTGHKSDFDAHQWKVISEAEEQCDTCKKTRAHAHTFDTSKWEQDATHHWHPATCGHTAAATKIPHSWKVVSIAEEECDVCTETRAHAHSLNTSKWDYDENNHWHPAACKHTDAHGVEIQHKGPEEKHKFADVRSLCEKGCLAFINLKSKSVKTEKLTPLTANIELLGITGGVVPLTSDYQPTVASFYIGKTEITQAQWRAVMGNNPSNGDNANYANGSDRNNCPANQVRWYAAITFCNKLSLKEGKKPCYSVAGVVDWENLAYSSVPTVDNATWNAAICDFYADGYRLPTEAEWEYAARGGENHKYSGSNTITDVAWYNENSGLKVNEVQKLNSNGYGLYDMSGNVYEWCWDKYDATGYNESQQENPTGKVTTGSNRVVRGGSRNNTKGADTKEQCEVGFRDSVGPQNGYLSGGFRIVCNALDVDL